MLRTTEKLKSWIETVKLDRQTVKVDMQLELKEE